jgi:hypothetical protein
MYDDNNDDYSGYNGDQLHDMQVDYDYYMNTQADEQPEQYANQYDLDDDDDEYYDDDSLATAYTTQRVVRAQRTARHPRRNAKANKGNNVALICIWIAVIVLIICLSVMMSC